MSILVTGGCGYIGAHTAAVLHKLGHEVVLYDNLVSSAKSVLDNLQIITGHAFPFVEGDVRDSDLVLKTLASYEIKAVIHFAGLKVANESILKPSDYYANNVQGTLSLLRAMQKRNIKKLIFSSSATVYGKPQYLPCDEKHPTSPINPYGRSKCYVEEILFDVVTADPAWRVACLRYFNPVGAHESGLIGDGADENSNNLMPHISQVAAGIRTELNIFGDDYPTQDGTGIRDYIHVMDLAEAHIAALDFLTQATGWHAINVGTGKGYSVLEIIHAFEQVSRRKIPYRVRPRRTGDVAESYADTRIAKKLLQWSATRTLLDMCLSAWMHQQSGAGGHDQ